MSPISNHSPLETYLNPPKVKYKIISPYCPSQSLRGKLWWFNSVYKILALITTNMSTVVGRTRAELATHPAWCWPTAVAAHLNKESQWEFKNTKKTESYWTIYRGPGFLAFVWFGSTPTPYPPPSPVSKVTLFLSLSVCRRSSLLTEEGGGGWSRIIRPQESLALHKTFNTLCEKLYRRVQALVAQCVKGLLPR